MVGWPLRQSGKAPPGVSHLQEGGRGDSVPRQHVQRLRQNRNGSEAHTAIRHGQVPKPRLSHVALPERWQWLVRERSPPRPPQERGHSRGCRTRGAVTRVAALPGVCLRKSHRGYRHGSVRDDVPEVVVEELHRRQDRLFDVLDPETAAHHPVPVAGGVIQHRHVAAAQPIGRVGVVAAREHPVLRGVLKLEQCCAAATRTLRQPGHPVRHVGSHAHSAHVHVTASKIRLRR
mmetsp:Transcript_18430/g.69800  ORF Transcript_18430/g.69800 Transcript_18430/m.69800 type:complete len:232 (-) Transcript_18430:491-1186(-)